MRTAAGRKPPFSRWPGETVVIFASGPSLTVEQCKYVRQRHAAGLCRAIAINTTFKRAPWVDTIYGFDRAWWKRYHEETPRTAEKVTGDRWAAETFGLSCVDVKPGFSLGTTPGRLFSGRNSGHQAIQYAYQTGAARILLLGYDMQHTGGLRHWHGDHPKGLTNAEGIGSWVKGFEPLAKALEHHGVDVVNCTTETALTCFKRGAISDYL